MEYHIKIEGMSCNNCVKHVTHALEEVDGVTRVRVSLSDKEAVVHGHESVSEDALANAVASAGYKAI